MTDLTRRALLTVTGVATIAALAGCAPGEPSTEPTSEGTPDMAPTRGSSAAAGTLLVFFSRPGENYWEGGRRNLEVGNTKVIAQMIQERIDCDVYEILAADPYPESYDPTVERNQREQNANARPAIDGELPEMSGYSTILLGSPVWNTRAPMIMRTFLEQVDELAGKTVHPFLTYAVGEGSVFPDYAEFCPDADIREGFAVRGEDARDAADNVQEWLARSSLIG